IRGGGSAVQGYVLTRYGGASAMQLREVPEPVAGDGKVLIRVHAAGLNPVDHSVRQGKARPVWHLDLPLGAGSDLSRVAEAVGAGATPFAVGERVAARVDKLKLGAFARYAVVDESFVGRMPQSLDFED